MPPDHVLSRPTLPLQQSRGRLESSMSSVLKRKSPATSEPTLEHNKRSRESSAAPESNTSRLSSVSIPETVLESEPESAVPPARTPQNRSLAGEEPATPTPNAPSSAPVTPKASDDQAPVTPSPPITPPQVPSETLSTAVANPGITPLRLSSSNADPSSIDPSNSGSRRHPNARSKPPRNERSKEAIESNKMNKIDKPEMEEIMKYELCGNVYQHDKFFDEFLESNTLVREAVGQRIRSSTDFEQTSLLGYANNRWTIDPEIAEQRNEKKVYAPLARMLNVIGRAAYAKYTELFPNDQFRQKYHPFHDNDHHKALWDSPSDAHTSPDVVMASAQKEAHWADVELLVECKTYSDQNSRNKAYLQLARYARATFAHQIYRLRVLGFSLCGSIVNFVCFDRSGLLHSPDLDLSNPEDADLFVKYMIDLLTLRPEKFGYDTCFSFRWDADQNAVQTLFKFKDYEPRVVSELLCYRKCCCGRATCVCALGDDVLKRIWRPDGRPDEGETLWVFDGVFAVCQVKAFEHGKHTTKLDHPDGLRTSPSASFFYPHGTAKTVAGPPTSSFQSKSGSVPPAPAATGTSDEPVVHGPTPVVPIGIRRGIRVKSDILMPRGRSLFDAQNSLHLLMAIHDALLGIMAFTEAGKIHCDISAYNLLLINPSTHYGDKGWLNTPKSVLKPARWDYNGTGTKCPTIDNRSSTQASTSEYKCPRLQRVQELGRGPVCVIHDTEFTINEDRGEKEVHSDRTGTPAFISAQLLDSYMSQSKIARSYVHDAESLLWVLIWVVAHRSVRKDRWEVSDKAARAIRKLSSHDITYLWESKKGMLSDTRQLVSDIKMMGTELSKDLAPVIGELADFFYLYLYAVPLATPEPTTSDSDSDSDTVDPVTPNPYHQARLTLHKQYIEESRSQTFDRLFAVVNSRIARLKKRRVLSDL